MPDFNTPTNSNLDALLSKMRALLDRAYEAGQRDGVARLLAAAGQRLPDERKPYRAIMTADKVLSFARVRGRVTAPAVAEAFESNVVAAGQQLYKLHNAGKLTRVDRGVYVPAEGA